MSRNDPSFLERQKASQAAKLALIAKAKEKSINSADFAERQKERIAIAEARDRRQAEREAERAANAARIAAEKEAIDLEKKRAAEAEKLAREAEAQAKIQESLDLKAAQKANRDAKYAARQQRREDRRKGLLPPKKSKKD